MILTELPLAKVLSFHNGKKPPELVDVGYPVFGSNGKIGEAKTYNHENAVILGRVGAYCGSVEYCEGKFWASDNTIVVKALDGFDAKYLYFNLTNQPLRSYAGGAAQPLITHSILKSIKAGYHCYDEQQRIADILSAYDDLIENNRRRIALLEDAARQLYKEWFVRLRFPGHEHVKVIDGVPEGWERKTVGELCSFLSRGITPVYDDEATGWIINQKCIREFKVNLEPARPQSKAVPEQKLVRRFDVLVNSTGAGTLGRVAQNFHEIDNLTVDSHVTIVRPGEGVAPVWLGLSLILKEEFIATLGRGATNQTELSKDDIAAINFNIPSSVLLREFENQAASTTEMIVTLMSQNAQLAKARDLLLPRLMSGSLAV